MTHPLGEFKKEYNMPKVIYTDELFHYGVKGMKWGIRKERSSSSGTSSKAWRTAAVVSPVGTAIAYGGHKAFKGIKNSNVGAKIQKVGKVGSDKSKSAINTAKNLTGSRSSKALKAARRKNIDQMSNKELQETVNRLNLERNYRSLTKVDFMKGQKAAANALKYDNTYKAVKKAAKTIGA